MLAGFAERFPARVLLWPVRVQGETCAAEVAAAIRGFNALPAGGPMPRPDVLIVARGGGSLEDLWGFNEEIVVRAAAASAIPLISAVGHETDWTLIDLAADARAPTPTKAAEWAVPEVRASWSSRRASSACASTTAARRGARGHARASARGRARAAAPAGSAGPAAPALRRRGAAPGARAAGERARARHAPGALRRRACSRGCWRRASRARATGWRLWAGARQPRWRAASRRAARGWSASPAGLARSRSATAWRAARERLGRLQGALRQSMLGALARPAPPSRRLRQAAGLAQLPGRAASAASRWCATARAAACARCAQVVAGQRLDIELADGHVEAQAHGQARGSAKSRSPARAIRSRRSTKPAAGGNQGSLF